MIATCQCNILQHCWEQHVTPAWPPCCDMLKMVKFFMQHLWMLHDVVVVWPGSCNNVVSRHAHQLDFQYPTPCNRVAKRANMLARQCCNTCMLHSIVAIVWQEVASAGPTTLGYVVLKCCDHYFGQGLYHTFGYFKFPLFRTTLYFLFLVGFNCIINIYTFTVV